MKQRRTTFDQLPPNTRENYAFLKEHKITHPLVIDSEGVLRFERNPAVRWAADRINLNDLWLAAELNHWPLKAMEKFYRDMGYSLCGYLEIFGDKWDTAARLRKG